MTGDKWNFDEGVNREGTSAAKWDQEFLKKYFKVEDVLPLWVADMDFKAPEALLNALKSRMYQLLTLLFRHSLDQVIKSLFKNLFTIHSRIK